MAVAKSTVAVARGYRWGVAAALWAAVAASGGAVAQTGAGGTGLDSLPEGRLQAELAQRGLNSLLERAFEVNRVPAEQRQATRALIALKELTDPTRRLSPRDVDALVTPLVSGMEAALPTQRDPAPLVSQAERVIQALVFPQLNTLEYWGETPANRARLRPVAGVASKMLARAAELARAQADDVANKLTGPNDPAVARYEQLDQLALKAEFTGRMNNYAVVASRDIADDDRAKIAVETLDYLRQFDNADSSVQGTVRVQMGKLLLATGQVADAARVLDSVWKEPNGITPEATVSQQYEARYFAAVAELRGGDVAGATTRLAELRDWQKTALGANASALAGADAAAMMLQYRIDVANKDDEKARQTLIALVRQRPEFESTVLEQLAGKVPENADLKTLDLLVLRAIFRGGEGELAKPEGSKVDDKVLGQAIAAGRELVSRRGKSGVDSGLVEDTAIRLPLLLERSGKTAAAAGALLDFIDAFSGTHKNAPAALDEAAFLVAKIRRENPEDVEVGKLYERLLAMAVVPPFSRREYAYEWARRLQQTGRFAESVAFFEQVPDTDPRADLAGFFRMVALKQVLDDSGAKLPEEDRKRRTGQLLKLADEVAAGARKRLAAGGAERKNEKLILVRTALVGSDVALRGQKDPAKTLKLLEGFEGSAAGLAGERELVSQAMNVRVLALMDLGKNQEATRTLVALLEKTGGDEGADVVFRLLTRLNADFDAAKAAGDAAAVRSLATARAELSGFLVQWAEENPDPKIRESTYRYRVFDADTKRLAADLESDPAARRKGLEASLALYQGLRATPQGAADPVVELGVALISYETGQYAEARDLLAKLLEQRRLGRPTVDEDRNGETVAVPNDRYWDATLKLMRSTLKLVEAGSVDAGAKQGIVDGLKALYARWGKNLGGARWAPEFEALRKEIAPDYVAPDL